MKPSKNLASGTLFDDIKVKLQKANANNIIKGMGGADPLKRHKINKLGFDLI